MHQDTAGVDGDQDPLAGRSQVVFPSLPLAPRRDRDRERLAAGGKEEGTKTLGGTFAQDETHFQELPRDFFCLV